MSNKNRKKEYVSKEIKNLVAYMFEYALCCFMPSGEFLKENLSDDTYKKYCIFIEALSNDVGHLKCDECTDEYVIECGYNFK